METLAVFAGGLAWLLWRMAPSLMVGDSGEFAAAGAILGVAHSPGYPFYLLWAKAAQILLPGSLVYRTNVLSALAVAGSWTLLWRLWRNATTLPIWALLPFLLLAFGLEPLQAAGAETEVFALLALSALLVFWLLERGRILAALFVFGLALGNHQTLLLISPAFLFLAWVKKRSENIFSWRWLGAGTLALGLGFSVYAYLPIAAARRPALNWGNPDNVSGFFRVLTRRDYGSVSLTVEGASARRVLVYARQIARWLGPSAEANPAGAIFLALGLLSGSWGVMSLFARAQPASSLAAAAFFGAVLSGPFFLCLGNPPFDPQTSGALERFQVLPFLCLAMAAPLPFGDLRQRFRNVRAAKLAAAGMSALAALSVVLSAPLSRRRNFLLYDFGRNILRSLPPHSYFFMEGGDDPMYSTAYFLLAENRRPDLGAASEPWGLHARDRASLVYPGIYGFEFRTTPRDTRERLRDSFEADLALRAPLFYLSLNLDLIAPAKLIPAGIVQYREHSGINNEPQTTIYAPSNPKQRTLTPIFLWPFYSYRGLDGPHRPHYRERSLVPYYFFARAQTAAYSNRPDDALRDFRAALAKGADALWLADHVAREAGRYGAQLFEERRHEQALELTQMAARRAPGEPSYAVNVCVILDKLERIEDSLACYAGVQQGFGDYPGLYKNWGATLIKAGRHVESRAIFRRYWEITKDPWALRWLGGESH
ncbi:MAG: DUF2723 domain-containing protein [Elusimicrobiota bacterium]